MSERTRDEWIARGYKWGCGISLCVPLVFAFLIFIVIPPGDISPLAFILLLFAAAAWISGCFVYGMYCVEQAYKIEPKQ